MAGLENVTRGGGRFFVGLGVGPLDGGIVAGKNNGAQTSNNCGPSWGLGV